MRNSSIHHGVNPCYSQGLNRHKGNLRPGTVCRLYSVTSWMDRQPLCELTAILASVLLSRGWESPCSNHMHGTIRGIKWGQFELGAT